MAMVKQAETFVYVKNVVQANILAALADQSETKNSVYNIACGGQITLDELAKTVQHEIGAYLPNLKPKILYQDFRDGDIRPFYCRYFKGSAFFWLSSRV